MQNVNRVAITNYDPFAIFLRKNIKLTPLGFAIAIFVADLIVDAFLGFRYNVFYSTSHNPGILQDLTALATDFVANPVISFVYLWVLDGATTLYQELLTNKVFSDESLVWQRLEKIKKIYESKILFYITLFFATLFTINQLASYNHWLPWKTLAGYLYIYPEMSYFRVPFWFISIYGLVFALLNAGITFIGLQSIFREPQALKLYHSHPDHCAGFGSIGKFLTNTGFVVAPISLWVSITVISESRQSNLLDVYPVLLIIFVYLVFAPVIFLWPILSAHYAMVKAKNKLLLEISAKINAAKDEIVYGNAVTKKQWETIEVYQNIYDQSVKLPEWPFNLENIQRFFAIVGSSLIPAIGSYVLDFALSLLPRIRSLFP